MRKFKIILYSILILILSFGVLSFNEYEVMAFGDEIIISCDYIETTLIEGQQIMSQNLDEDKYFWNLNSERQMRKENPQRTIGDYSDLFNESFNELENMSEVSNIDPQYIVPPTILPEVSIEGEIISTDNGINNYDGVLVSYSIENGVIDGYYSRNGGSLVYFDSPYYFVVPGNYTLTIYDNNDSYIYRFNIIDHLNDNISDIIGSEGEGTFEYDAETLNLGYQTTYSRHYFSVSYNSTFTRVKVHSKFIWDVAPYERNVDIYTIAIPGNLQIFETNPMSLEFNQRYIYTDSIFETEFDGYTWISGYETTIIDYEPRHTFDKSIEYEGQHVLYGDVFFYSFLVNLPEDLNCSIPGYTSLPARVLETVEFDIYAYFTAGSNFFDYNDRTLFASDYKHGEVVFDSEELFDLSFDIVSRNIGVSINLSDSFNLEYTSISTLSYILERGEN